MSDPFIGEIKMVGFTFAPSGWAFCNGQTISIQQNTALFSLLGTIYGGDGSTTFGLPNLQGRAPMHRGTGPGLTPRTQGNSGGAATVTLTANTMAPHTHTPMAVQGNNAASPKSNAWGSMVGRTVSSFYQSGTANVTMSAAALDPAGSASPAPHNNLQPYLAVNFVIAMTGIYPVRE
ncbi:MAG: phage tail protein [Anaerolineales bacterium]|nr:phage tail protein [Anaerolineales bacterium]